MIFTAFLRNLPCFLSWTFPLNFIIALCFLLGIGLEWLTYKRCWWIFPLLLLVFIGVMELLVLTIYDEPAQSYLIYGIFATSALLGNVLCLSGHWIWKRVHS